MDRIDELLTDYFRPTTPPPGLAARVGRLRPAERASLPTLVERFRIEATDRGVARIELRRAPGPPAREVGHAGRAREELREYLAGQRTFFSVPVDLSGLPAFQTRVLREAGRIPFGEVASYAALARRIGHPRAARAVGNALGANPVPLIVPCHRVIRGDGTWGHYAFGGEWKTRLLTLERTTPVLVGCETTRIVCRRGCAHERRIREDRRIVFASLDDAASVGYRTCRVCRPAL
jgi:O-6-methylguanine DNA methyltransferase